MEQGQQPVHREIEGGSAPVVEQGLQPAQPAHRGWAPSNTWRETPTCIKHMCVVGPTTGAGWVGRPQHMQWDAYLHQASVPCWTHSRRRGGSLAATRATRRRLGLRKRRQAGERGKPPQSCAPYPDLSLRLPLTLSPVAPMDSGTRMGFPFKTVSKRWFCLSSDSE